jgi:undecaprenyl diphosphate synthase
MRAWPSACSRWALACAAWFWASRRLNDLADSGTRADFDRIAFVLDPAGRGIEVLTIYAFSRENWQRSSAEVETLIGLLDATIRELPITHAHARGGAEVSVLQVAVEVDGYVHLD